MFDGAPQLRHVSRIGIGYDAVDVAAATARGVVVTNTPGANANAVADFTMGLLLGVARWIPLFDREVKSGTWQSRLGGDVWQKTLGIVGLGNIGRGVARRARGFDMKILAYEPYPDQAFVREHGIDWRAGRVFAESDFVTLHLPSSAETENTVNARTLGLMKPTAYLVNAARGPLVDEDALYRALAEKRIAGAALDVRVVEPNYDDPLQRPRQRGAGAARRRQHRERRHRLDPCRRRERRAGAAWRAPGRPDQPRGLGPIPGGPARDVGTPVTLRT